MQSGWGEKKSPYLEGVIESSRGIAEMQKTALLSEATHTSRRAQFVELELAAACSRLPVAAAGISHSSARSIAKVL